MGCGIQAQKNKLDIMQLEIKSRRLSTQSGEIEKHTQITQLTELRSARRMNNDLKEETGDLTEIKPNLKALTKNDNKTKDALEFKANKSYNSNNEQPQTMHSE
ncbi:Hypothetical_protein [Hexamita inflata]|uniref:Hypothetical_protein n=1 Tax=Hexamita inflata TaxID=28002 RepID=A0AA86P854_9EUKA|nr:Hypothetical protein HINF_LOCUS21537 [Hexamita inflata]CAI9948531.1 Hypothetical protein HINF_LOCUS36176 [Hexamita inflata]CAI9974056.1 Hypothetical protein HINF_LOCUS61701 [Hexamita inflata]